MCKEEEMTTIGFNIPEEIKLDYADNVRRCKSNITDATVSLICWFNKDPKVNSKIIGLTQ